jgi:hypothetical protein
MTEELEALRDVTARLESAGIDYPKKDDEPTEGNEDREESWSYENFAAHPESD